MSDTPVTLTLTLNEANGVLMALARLPYGEVAALIAKIQDQAKPQVETKDQ